MKKTNKINFEFSFYKNTFEERKKIIDLCLQEHTIASILQEAIESRERALILFSSEQLLKKAKKIALKKFPNFKVGVLLDQQKEENSSLVLLAFIPSAYFQENLKDLKKQGFQRIMYDSRKDRFLDMLKSVLDHLHLTPVENPEKAPQEELNLSIDLCAENEAVTVAFKKSALLLTHKKKRAKND